MNYRKICQRYYGYTNEQMKGMDVHHKDGNRNNNDPENLILITPEEHREIHSLEFVVWARRGAKLGNAAFIKRLKDHGPTEKELAYREIRIQACKGGLHRTPHTEETKKTISENKKVFLADKTNHPMWGNTRYKVYSPDGEIFIVDGGWKDWCKERGLSASNLRSVALGSRKHCKGWKAEIVSEE